MKWPRPRLSLKILLVAFLNLALLALIFLVFGRTQFRLDLGSFFLTPVRDRMLSVSRLIALQLVFSPQENWTRILDDAANSYPAHFYLFSESGDQIAGTPVKLPPKFVASIKSENRHRFRRDWAPGDDRAQLPPQPRPGRADGPPDLQPGEVRPVPQLHLTRVSNPPEYWASVHLPWALQRGGRVRPGTPPPAHAIIVWRFSNFWTSSFFFDLSSWIAVALAMILVSVACWLPLVRNLTRAISQLTAATGRIAEGHFEIQLATRRRDELGSLSESISRMAHRLSGLVQGQRRFLSDIAHELSSPIARAQLALAILEQRVKSETEAEYIGDVREEVEHMSSLVNELLAFSKSQSIDSSVELESVNVADTARRVLQRESTDNAQIETHIDDKVDVIAQPEYLFRSLANIVRNAVRYASHAGPIVISAAAHGDEVTIAVSDRGPGLPEDELENVFRPFYRPEFARQRETGGAGLGLAIVRSCIEACGGSVTLRNRVPKGLEVAVRLPSAPAAARRSGQIAEDAAARVAG